MQELIEIAASKLAGARGCVALTGAGISVESGIPPFRGQGGVWERIDPMKYAHIDAFRRDPQDVWRVLLGEMAEVLVKARPNAAHRGLARLEALGILTGIITQNVDGLHQMAGSREVIEFHGSFAQLRCIRCGSRHSACNLDLACLPPRCPCGEILRPDVIFFGEMIPHQALLRARQLVRGCDVMLVIGTSATVEPAAYMPVMAKHCGACIIEINPEPTPLTHHISDHALMGKAGDTVRRIVAALERCR
jgi:NAD-dependent deacetylase